MRLLLIFLLVPLIEIGLFIQVGGLIGLWPTLLVVVATAVAGAIMLRQQGAHVLVQIRDSLSGGGDPSRALLHGLLVFVSALLLLTPGFFTDAIGFLLLFPRGRDFVIDIGKSAIVSNADAFADFQWRTSHRADDVVVEGTAEVIEQDQSDARR